MNPFLDIDNVPVVGDPLLSAVELAQYIEAYTRTGFRGGINWYRNIDQNNLAHPDIGVVPIHVPCLMLMAERDPALRPEFAEDMPQRCSNLEMHLIENAGHWVQQEQAEIFNRHLIPWLTKHFA